MLVLGLSGGFSRHDVDFVPGLPHWFFYDSAAVLLHDGKVVCAVEEERLNRIKQTNRFPAHAVQACLTTASASLADLDATAYFVEEDYTDRSLLVQYAGAPEVPALGSRALITRRLAEYLGEGPDPTRIRFVAHHLAHAQSVNGQSGFDRSLVLVVDAQGEGDAVSVYASDGWQLDLLTSKYHTDSLGHLYSWGTELLGFKAVTDEYKFMSLASYGRPEVFRAGLRAVYELRPDGDYGLDLGALPDVLQRAGIYPPRVGTGFEQPHRDFAAGVQEMLEEITLHVLRHWRKETGLTRLAVAGGVGQNCTLDGKLAQSGLFDDVVAHPAAHDAGAALGAAAVVVGEQAAAPKRARVREVFWGKPLPPPDALRRTLSGWADYVTAAESARVEHDAAAMLAAGEIIAWVQGLSEFGPRALGNRSILADPRPAVNRDRVNFAIKRRESFRPFAPSVKAERVTDYFEFPDAMPNPDFMVFTVPVRARAAGGARCCNARRRHVAGARRRPDGQPAVLAPAGCRRACDRRAGRAEHVVQQQQRADRRLPSRTR